MLPALLLTMACSDPGQLSNSTSDAGVPRQDQGIVPTADLTPDTGIPTVKLSNLTITPVSGTPSVFKVAWESSLPCTSHVQFGTTSDHDLRTPTTTTPTTKHQALLLGLPASSDVFVKAAVAPADGSPVNHIQGKASTGALPAELPKLTLSDHDPKKAEAGYTLMPILGADSTWLTLIDAKGRYVWWKKVAKRIFTAHLTSDRKAIVYLKHAVSTTVGGSLVIIPLDGSPTSEIQATGGHTDFVEISPGKYAVLGWEIRKIKNGTRKILGDTIMEVSASSPPKVVWNVFNYFTPSDNQTYPNGVYGTDPTVEDWSHVNGIHYDAGQNAYYLSAGPALDTIMRVERDTGNMPWSVGLVGNIKSADGKHLVSAPHSVQKLSAPDTVLVFNRAVPDGCSHAAEIHVNQTTQTATMKWSYQSKNCYKVYFLGDAERLDNGNTLVNWSTSGHIEEVTRDGDVVWSLRAQLGAGFGFIDRVLSLYK